MSAGRTKESVAAIGVSIGLFSLICLLPADGLAQAGNAGAGPSGANAGATKAPAAGNAGPAAAVNLDMRLWSIGDCNQRFPYVESPEHKECIRVVASDQAKDARAIYYCSISHADDPPEAARCKEAYFANKAEAEQEGFRAMQANPSLAVAPAATPAPKRDKDAEVAALTRALKASDAEERAAAPAPGPEPAPAPAQVPPSSSGSFSSIVLGLAIILLLVGIGIRYWRKTNEAKAGARMASRSSGGPKTIGRTPPKQY